VSSEVTAADAPPRSVSRGALVPATPAEVFELLADPRRHSEIDGSGTVKGVLVGPLRGPDRLSLGATFGMRMRLVAPYPIRNTVVEFEEGRRIAWRHLGRHVWRYTLEPVTGGTRVTETFDWSHALSPKSLELSGFPARNTQAIEATLVRLREHFQPAPA